MAQKENPRPLTKLAPMSDIVKKFVQKKGVVLDPSELFHTFPKNFQTEISRVWQTRKQFEVNNNQTTSSKAFGGCKDLTTPTPGKSARLTSRIPVPVKPSSSVKKSMVRFDESARKNTEPSTTSHLASARGIIGSFQNLATNQHLALKARSASFSSLYSMNEWTPEVSNPSVETRKSAFAMDSSNYHVTNTIKVPEANDKTALLRMAVCVIEFLRLQKYPKRMTLDEFNVMPTGEYLKICTFVGALMMGDRYFSGTVDSIGKICELANLLQYPGTISKSYLKYVNVPHTWRYALTFLYWLCARVKAAISPISSPKPIAEISYNNNREIASESHLVLFCQELSEGSVDPNLLQSELQLFRSTLNENYMSDISQTVEELVKKRDVELQKLNTLESLPDPLLRLTNDKNECQKEFENRTNCLKELKKLDIARKNASSAEFTRTAVLQLQYEEKVKKLEELKRLVNSQSMDITEMQQMRHKIKRTDDHIKVIGVATNNLDQQLLSKEAVNSVLEGQFYKVFQDMNAVVTKLREAARKCGVELPEISEIPFEISGFKKWVEEVEQVQKLAMSKVSTRKHEVQEKIKDIEGKKEQCLKAKDNLQKRQSDLEECFKNMKAQLNHSKKEQEDQISNISEEARKLQEDMEKLTKEKEDLNEECSTLQTKYDDAKKEMDEKQAEEDAWKEKRETLMNGLEEECRQMDEYLKNYIITKTIELREIRVQNNLDVELFDEILAEQGYPQIPPNNEA